MQQRARKEGQNPLRLSRHGGTGFIKPLENKGLTALKRESCTEVVQK